MKLIRISISLSFFIFLHLIISSGILQAQNQEGLKEKLSKVHNRYATIEEQTELFLTLDEQKRIGDLMKQFAQTPSNQQMKSGSYEFLSSGNQSLYGNQETFKRISRRVVYVLTEAIKAKDPWARDLDKVLAFLGIERHLLAKKSTGDESQNPYYGIRRDLTRYSPSFKTPLTSGKRLALGESSPYFDKNQDQRELRSKAVSFSYTINKPDKTVLHGVMGWGKDQYLILDPAQRSFCPSYHLSGEPYHPKNDGKTDKTEPWFHLSDKVKTSNLSFSLEVVEDILEQSANDKNVLAPFRPFTPWIIHPNGENIRKAMPFLKKLYEDLLKEFDQRPFQQKAPLPDNAKRFHYFMAEITPIGFGGGTIAEWLAMTMIQLFDGRFSHWKLETWAKAVTTPEKQFVEHYEEFFERGKLH